jgi:hypothetical protein
MVLLWLGIAPQTRQYQERLGAALQRLVAEDSSLAPRD